jgi:hypothetical protein
VRVHYLGESGDRFLTPLAAQVMRNHFGKTSVRDTSAANVPRKRCKWGHPLQGRNIRYYYDPKRGYVQRKCYACVRARLAKAKAA